MCNLDGITGSHGGGISTSVKSKESYLDIVNYLLENQADVDVVDNNQEKALVMASSGGHVDVVRALLTRRSKAKAETTATASTNDDKDSKDVDDEISSALKAAQWGGNTELIKLLRSYL